MTGREVYKSALAFLMEGEGEDKAFENSALGLINLALADLKKVQNSINIAEEREVKEEYKITSLEDEIPVDYPVAMLIPTYLASHFLRDDLEMGASENMYARYRTEKQELFRAALMEIPDTYGGDTYGD